MQEAQKPQNSIEKKKKKTTSTSKKAYNGIILGELFR